MKQQITVAESEVSMIEGEKMIFFKKKEDLQDPFYYSVKFC